MTTRPISDIEREIAVVRDLELQYNLAVESSDRPLVDLVFAASAHKRRRLLETELAEAKHRMGVAP